jgi:hypothetical protein
MPPSYSDTFYNFLKFIALYLSSIMSESEKGVKVSVDDYNFDSDAGPSLVYKLEEDGNRKEQLGFWNEKIDSRKKPALHRENEQQLLEDGKLGRSEFSARLQRVTFGTFESRPACRIVFLVDFCPSSQSWFRFRDATVEAEFQEEGRAIDTSADVERDYDGPLVLEFHPGLIHGHTRSIAETFNFTISAGLPAPMGNTSLSAAWSTTKPKESAYLIHGRLRGDPATRVEWKINENEITKSGIYEQPKFAIIVQNQDQAQFSMTLRIRATTLGGFPVIGKGGSRIIFTPKQRLQVDENIQPTLHAEETGVSGLIGGSISTSGQIWNSGSQSVSPLQDLAKVKLEDLTRMEAILLGEKGPGAAPVNIS